MEKRIGKLWHYDRVLNHRMNVLDELAARAKNLTKRINENGKRVVIPLKGNDSLIKESYLILMTEQSSNEVHLKDLTEEKVKTAKTLHDLMRKARPVLIGPATLESLINNTPDDYECIANEHLPFKNMFFEFYEPVKLGMPFTKKPDSVVGVHFYPTRLFYNEDVEENNKYAIEIYFTRKEKIRTMILTCNPETNAQFEGSTWDAKFSIDMDSRMVRYSLAEDMRKETQKGNFTYINSGEYHWKTSLDEIENNDFFVTIANFCTNTINYINSSNREIIERTRKVQIKTTDNNKGKKKAKVETREEPYSLIKITPVRYVSEPQHTGKSWELSCQFIVMGHPRRFRDDYGAIRKITWIGQFRKGPEDAPWKDQRHALIYEKMQREDKMFEEGKE